MNISFDSYQSIIFLQKTNGEFPWILLSILNLFFYSIFFLQREHKRKNQLWMVTMELFRIIVILQRVIDAYNLKLKIELFDSLQHKERLVKKKKLSWLQSAPEWIAYYKCGWIVEFWLLLIRALLIDEGIQIGESYLKTFAPICACPIPKKKPNDLDGITRLVTMLSNLPFNLHIFSKLLVSSSIWKLL